MTQEEVKSYFCTRQLTDYLTDWPKGEKGCMFLLKLDPNDSILHRYVLVIKDFPWRKGTQWEDIPKLLPIEKESFQNDSKHHIDYFGNIDEFTAILVAACVRNTSLSKDDVLSLWDEYYTRYQNRAYVWPRLDDAISFCDYKLTLSKENKKILKMLIPKQDKQTSYDYIGSLWEIAIHSWIDSIVQEMTPKKQLFDTNLELRFNGTIEEKIPVYVYDKEEVIQTPNGPEIKIDPDYYREEDEETYVVDKIILSKDTDDRLCAKYSFPSCIERKAIAVYYDEKNGGAKTTLISDDYYGNPTLDITYLSYGLITFIIQYSATGMLLKACKEHDVVDALLILINNTNELTIDKIDISITKDVYDMYFKHFCEQYYAEHKDDSDYFSLSESEQIAICAKEAKTNEREKINDSDRIYQYLTPEQGERLKKYVENYLKYLDRVLSEVQETPEQLESHHLVPPTQDTTFCTYIVPNTGKTREEIEADLVRTSKKTASVFASCLNRLEKQGCLDFGKDTCHTIFDYLKKRYTLSYGYTNFSLVFRKDTK